MTKITKIKVIDNKVDIQDESHTTAHDLPSITAPRSNDHIDLLREHIDLQRESLETLKAIDWKLWELYNRFFGNTKES